MTGNRDLFEDFKPLEGGSVSGVGGALSIKGSGTLRVGKIVLTDVAYVPGLPVNLLSVRAASSRGNSNMHFNADGVQITTPDRKHIFNGFIKNGLHILNNSNRFSLPEAGTKLVPLELITVLNL